MIDFGVQYASGVVEFVVVYGCSDKEAEDTAPPQEEVQTDHPICNALELPTRPMIQLLQRCFVVISRLVILLFCFAMKHGRSEKWTGARAIFSSRTGFRLSSAGDLLVDRCLGSSHRIGFDVHYFFVPARASQGDVDSLGEQMEGWIEEAMAGLTENQAKWWRDRLHVVGASSSDLSGLVGDGFNSDVAYFGFGIDREQKICPWLFSACEWI